MENASKAILISGAILIAIILISLGVKVISSQKEAINTSKDSADVVAKNTFNSQFEKYVGTRKGSEVKQLLIDIETSNSVNPDKYVAPPGLSAADVKPYARYKVSCGKTNGWVSSVSVTLVK